MSDVAILLTVTRGWKARLMESLAAKGVTFAAFARESVAIRLGGKREATPSSPRSVEIPLKISAILHLRLPRDTYEAVKRAAEAEGRTPESFIVCALVYNEK